MSSGKVLLVSLALALGLFTVLDLAFDYRLPYLAAIALYLGIYGVVHGVSARLASSPEARATPAGPPSGWPTSGPIGRFGQTGLVIAFTASGMLCALNPLQLAQILRQAVGNSVARLRPAPAAGEHRSAVTYSLPFDGEWFVYNGGFTPATSHSWGVIAQRYAYDFLVADQRVARHSGDGTSVTDYFCYGRDILAAADGEVVRTEARIGGAPFVGWGVVDFFARSFFGNHVLIRHADGEYALYAHLIRASVAVQEGDRVLRGQRIGRCGHSGHSSEPHLHFHVQDSADLYFGRGVPVRFGAVSVDGNNVALAQIESGSRVANLPGATT